MSDSEYAAPPCWPSFFTGEYARLGVSVNGNAATEKTEAIRKATPNQTGWTPIQRQWLAMRVTRKGTAVKYGTARWPSQRDIAAELRVSAMAVQRMETELEARPDVRAFLAVLCVPLRKPRGNRKTVVTKRKIVRHK